MKRIILSILFALASLFANAEERGWYFSGIANYGVTDISSTSYSVNLTMGYMLKPYLGVFGGLGIQVNNSFTWEGRAIATGSYFQLPAFIRFITSKSGRVGFYSDLGIKANFKISEQVYDSRFGNNSSYNIDALIFVRPGIKIPFSKMVSLNLGPELSAGSLDGGVFLSGSLNIFLGKTLKPKTDAGALQDW